VDAIIKNGILKFRVQSTFWQIEIMSVRFKKQPPSNEKLCFGILKTDLFVFVRYSGPPTPIIIRRPKTKPSGTGQVARFQVKFARQTPRSHFSRQFSEGRGQCGKPRYSGLKNSPSGGRFAPWKWKLRRNATNY